MVRSLRTLAALLVVLPLVAEAKQTKPPLRWFLPLAGVWGISVNLGKVLQSGIPAEN